jgi:hypothetical protein
MPRGDTCRAEAPRRSAPHRPARLARRSTRLEGRVPDLAHALLLARRAAVWSRPEWRLASEALSPSKAEAKMTSRNSLLIMVAVILAMAFYAVSQDGRESGRAGGTEPGAGTPQAAAGQQTQQAAAQASQQPVSQQQQAGQAQQPGSPQSKQTGQAQQPGSPQGEQTGQTQQSGSQQGEQTGQAQQSGWPTLQDALEAQPGGADQMGGPPAATSGTEGRQGSAQGVGQRIEETTENVADDLGDVWEEAKDVGNELKQLGAETTDIFTSDDSR